MALTASKKTPPARWQRTGFTVAAAATLIAYGGLVALDWRTGTLRGASTPSTILWLLLAFAAFAGLLYGAERAGSSSLRRFWLLALAARLLLLFTTPSLSDDVYRYLWDGHLGANGVSPYAFAIEAPALDPLDHPVRAQANNAWMASPYLPAAQALFWGVARWLPLTPLSLQVMMLLFDLLTALIISRLLRLAGLPPGRLLLYLLNPLVIVEVAHGAHIDAWMTLLTFLALWATLAPVHRRAGWLAPGALALATLTKVLPALVAPILFWRWSWRQRIAYGIIGLLLLLPAGWRAGWGLFGDLDGTGVFGALRIYVRQWQFNSGIFYWLAAGLQRLGLANPAGLAGAITSTALIALLAAIWLRARNMRSPRALLRLCGLAFAAYLPLTPTVHPWYALIVLAFTPFWPPAVGEGRWRWLWALPWLWLSATLIFSYLSYSDPNNFRELAWVRLLQWGPALLLMGAAIFAGRRAGKNEPHEIK